MPDQVRHDGFGRDAAHHRGWSASVLFTKTGVISVAYAYCRRRISEKKMRLFKRFALAGLLACTAAAGAAQTQPSPVQPAARWHVDGATDRCVLTRRLEGTP